MPTYFRIFWNTLLSRLFIHNHLVLFYILNKLLVAAGIGDNIDTCTQSVLHVVE